MLAGAFAAAAPLAPAERAVLLVCVAAVIAAEAANTAVEAIVDLVSPGWSERARIAKDAAAGAVLALAAGSVLALAAIAAARWDELSAAWPALQRPASRAAIVAAAAGVLPWRAKRRSGARDAILAALGAASLADFARSATAHAGTAAMALCLAIALAGAWRKRRLGGP